MGFEISQKLSRTCVYIHFKWGLTNRVDTVFWIWQFTQIVGFEISQKLSCTCVYIHFKWGLTNRVDTVFWIWQFTQISGVEISQKLSSVPFTLNGVWQTGLTLCFEWQFTQVVGSTRFSWHCVNVYYGLKLKLLTGVTISAGLALLVFQVSVFIWLKSLLWLVHLVFALICDEIDLYFVWCSQFVHSTDTVIYDP